MTGSSFRRVISACSSLALGAVLFGAPLTVGAQEATPAGSPMALPSNCTVVASQLHNPRGITVGPDGTLYIAEAGDGGQTPDFATPMAGTPTASEPATTHGDTGRITIVSPDGTQSVLVDGLTSYFFGTEVVGPAGVTVASDGTVYVSVGGPGPNTAAFPPAGNADRVISVDASGNVTEVADIGAYERSNNPDPNAVDSNLGGIAAGSDGLLYVADAGGNTIYSVDPASGNLSVVAVIPGLPSPGGAANPERGGNAEVDPVPTDVEADPNGGVYVSLLTGAMLWGTPGSAKVLHVAADGTITDAATGLDLVVGVAVGGDGSIYASQLSTNMMATPPAAGSVVRVTAGGSPEVVVSDLPFPYGIAIGPDGSLYVAINTSAPPGTEPSGAVLKCDVGATAPSMATPVAALAGYDRNA